MLAKSALWSRHLAGRGVHLPPDPGGPPSPRATVRSAWQSGAEPGAAGKLPAGKVTTAGKKHWVRRHSPPPANDGTNSAKEKGAGSEATTSCQRLGWDKPVLLSAVMAPRP